MVPVLTLCSNYWFQVLHCHDSVVYVLAPLKYVSVVGCSDSIIVLGAVGKVRSVYFQLLCWKLNF